MLGVPEEIKQLLKQSSVAKNLRIHFPGGEHKDITNDNLVSESFSFTESLCSREKLKLGLCEASTVEFETIGVGNIKGCMIECHCEVDISSLSEEFITEYGMISEDVGYPYYRIPYGTFIVDSCPRDAGNMQLRKVCAYSKIAAENWEWNKDFVRAVCYPWAYDTDVDVAIEDIMIVHFPELEELTEDDLVSDTITNYIFGTNQKDPYELKVEYKVVDEILFSKKTLWHYKIHIDDEYYKMVDSFVEFVNELGDISLQEKVLKYIDSIKYARKSKSFMKGKDNYQYEKLVMDSEGYFTRKIGIPRAGSQEELDYFDAQLSMEDNILKAEYESAEYLPAVYEDLSNANNIWEDNAILYRMCLKVPIGVTLSKRDDGKKEELYSFTCLKNLFYSKERGINETLLSGILNLKRTKKNFHVLHFDTSNGIAVEENRISYSVDEELINSINLKELAEDYCELKGSFGRFKRSGKFELLKLNSKVSLFPSERLYPREDLYPKGVETLLSRALYSKVWYADEKTKLYNKVICVYKNSSGIQQTAEHIIVDTDRVDDDGNLIYDSKMYQEYDITNNYFIKNGTYSGEEISGILANVASGLVGIQYMPAEVETRGRPDIEVGDGLQVLTESDGFETIVLRRTLSGIQALADEYESK